MDIIFSVLIYSIKPQIQIKMSNDSSSRSALRKVFVGSSRP
jgi:hypothetical protein